MRIKRTSKVHLKSTVLLFTELFYPVAPSKKARRDKDTADFCTAKEKPQVALSIVSKTQSTTSSAERGDVSGAESDILKTKKKRGARKIIDDDEEEENTKVPISSILDLAINLIQ